MGAFATVTIQDQMRGNVGRICNDGSIRASPGVGTGESQTFTATPAWAQLVGANTARRQIQIQNQSPTVAAFIRFRLDPFTPGSPYRIDPGVTYAFPAGVSYRGEIEAMANPTADLCAIEFNEPEDVED